jgi:hypothetical protein
MYRESMNMFLEYDPALTGSVFGLLMFLGWLIGARMARRAQAQHTLSRFDDAALALFGLLLAFCFSGAASRYDLRKKLVLDEATAIGDFSGACSVLAEPERTQVADELKRYVALRLEFGQLHLDDAQMPALVTRTRASQDRLCALVAQAVRTLNTPSAHTSLINTMNEFTTAYENRLQSLRDSMPESIVAILMLFGVFSTFTMGRVAEGARRGSAFAYIALVGLVFWIVLDLEMPRRGWLRVPEWPMHELASHLSGS